jgi:hypothetical protein
MSSDPKTLPGEREVAGLRCGQVLAGLTEYLAGGLDRHVRGCSHCERFGGEFGRAVRAIRASAAEPPEAVLARLEARLASR